MDYGALISRSFDYTKDALTEKWTRWILLAILSFLQALTLSLVPLLSGYLVRVLSGKTPAPEVDEWGRLFIDGWKLNIIILIYIIPTVLIFLLFGGLGAVGMLASAAVGGDAALIGAAIASILAGMFLAGIVAIITAFVALFAILRFARTGRIGDAFNLGAIFSQIGSLGWGTWIITVVILLVVAFIYGIVVGALGQIPFVGWIIVLFLNAAFAVFAARYLALVYEEAPTAA